MISCNDYDYIEIACLYHYPIKLTLKTGGVIEGRALDTQRINAREEGIKVDVSGTQSTIALDDIVKLEVTIDNPHFREVSFA
ncbi:MAG: Rho-binding antiterminator [Granulosicoccus sp.]|nr:Rho-binding antiterminator [Granulosicoccus sp.]